MRDTIDMAREAAGGLLSYDEEDQWYLSAAEVLRLVELVRADERMSFYGQDKPVECADGCPPNQICDYCQVVAPVKAMILAEREACAKVCDDLPAPDVYSDTDKSMWDVACMDCAEAIRAKGEAK